MGPRSTAPFIDMLVNSSQVLYGAKYDMGFPTMHIISLPTPFYPGQVIDDRAMIQALQHGISDLVRAEVDLIAVPCNLAI
jgi:aspartate racemase